MGENNSKWKTDETLISKISKKLNARKNKQPSPKGDRRPKQTFLQKDIQMTNKHEKMLNIAHYQRNANQNYNEVSPHTGQNGHHQ